MKPSSTDTPTSAPSAPQPARFDRQLGEFGGSWIDAEAERRIARIAERARQQAISEGYATGWSQGRQAAAVAAEEERQQREADAERRLRELATRVDHAVAGLVRAAAQVQATTMPQWEELADVFTDGALAIARAALGRELSRLDGAAVLAVREAITMLGSPEQVTVRVGPADHALLSTMAEHLSTTSAVALLLDPALAPGQIETLTLTQRLQLHLPDGLAAAEEVLRS